MWVGWKERCWTLFVEGSMDYILHLPCRYYSHKSKPMHLRTDRPCFFHRFPNINGPFLVGAKIQCPFNCSGLFCKKKEERKKSIRKKKESGWVLQFHPRKKILPLLQGSLEAHRHLLHLPLPVIWRRRKTKAAFKISTRPYEIVIKRPRGSNKTYTGYTLAIHDTGEYLNLPDSATQNVPIISHWPACWGQSARRWWLSEPLLHLHDSCQLSLLHALPCQEGWRSFASLPHQTSVLQHGHSTGAGEEWRGTSSVKVRELLIILLILVSTAYGFCFFFHNDNTPAIF